MVKGYLSSRDLCKRYRCSTRTLDRWMKRDEHPLPKPRIHQSGAPNLWAIDDIEVFEAFYEPEPA